MQPRIFAVMHNGSINIKTNFLGKFLNDELIMDTEDYSIAIRGVILNSSELFAEQDMKSYVMCKLHEGREDFFKDFRGNFFGVIFNKHTKKCLAFTDHFGTHTVFYGMGGGGLS